MTFERLSAEPHRLGPDQIEQSGGTGAKRDFTIGVERAALAARRQHIQLLEHEAHGGVQHKIGAGHDAIVANAVLDELETLMQRDQTGGRRRVDGITRPCQHAKQP